MKKPKPLDYKSLRQTLSPSRLLFNSSNKIKPLNEFVGQDRALESLEFGIGIKSHGYNLYAMGPSGIGKLSLVKAVISKHASKLSVPPDWCYVHNFDMPENPIALEFAAGQGIIFLQDMKKFIEEVGNAILTVFESDEYRIAMRKITHEYNIRRKNKRKRKKTTAQNAKVSHLYREKHDQEKQLQTKLVMDVITPLTNKLAKKYIKSDSITQYLEAVKNDIVRYPSDFIKADEKNANLLNVWEDNPVLVKYKVNLIVDNSKTSGAPVIFEEVPTYSNLISRIEHTSQLGTLATNFTLIKAGSLLQANGGYLIVEMRKLKKNKEAWEALKSALYAKSVRIESTENEVDSVKPISLKPMSIPLQIKIILIGDRSTYYSLAQHDPDFSDLFKVPVDFDEQIDRTPKNIQLYARMISTIAQREKLRPFRAAAVAAIIDHTSRLAEDIEKLSTHIRDIEDLVLEADYWAGIEKKKTVNALDVERAIDAQTQRMDRSRELYYEDINRDFIIIKTEGKSLGQVNCLSVRRVGNFSYGHPTRVTARVRMGKGKIIDIQREIKMAGPLHSKAGLIIANFLASRFNKDHLFSLSASLSFEQIYCWTDGDSASVGELCALLSALADIPIQQQWAVTGSIDQYGEVQAIGGVNEKIEGFFDVCKARGLNGKQGVLIPAINKKNLMLRKDVVEAAKNKQFFIVPINTVDEAVLLLTGMNAGERDKNGEFPAQSLYAKIENRLKKYSKTLPK